LSCSGSGRKPFADLGKLGLPFDQQLSAPQ
jgi:hypothetical protein